MAFRFALAPLLRLRRSVERQRTLALQEAAMRLARSQEMVGWLERFLAESAMADAASLEAGRRGAELQFAAILREQLQQLGVRLKEEVRRLEEVREQAATAYQQAYREREVLDNLRVRQRSAYQVDQLRREQRRLDAAYLLQRWRNRGG